jgi:hypothetical protein
MKAKLTNYLATMKVEGLVPVESEEEILEAWQYLHDTGLAYQLQGWYGRTAQSLVEQGLISDMGRVPHAPREEKRA